MKPAVAAIGLFNDSYPPIFDGVTTAVVSYARYLYEHGQNPCVVAPANPAPAPAAPYPVMRYFSLPIHGRKPYRYGYPKLDLTIKPRLRHTPFRLVHSHSPFSAGRLAVYAARKHNIPLIGTFHSKYRVDLEHSLHRLPWLIKKTMKRLLEFYNSCDYVWIPQKSVEDTIREYGYRGQIEVVENGNDLATVPIAELASYKRQTRKSLGIADDTVTLLFVGQHIWEKGIGVILDTISMLHSRGVKIRMDFVGSGYASEEVRRRICACNLQEVAAMHGVITDRSRLADMYAAADLFLFPSCYDNAPIVVKEAAAMGTASILPAGCTAAEVITDGNNGFLCRRDAQSYTEIIESLAADRNRMHNVGLGARRTLARSWENVMEEVVERYNEILAYGGKQYR